MSSLARAQHYVLPVHSDELAPRSHPRGQLFCFSALLLATGVALVIAEATTQSPLAAQGDGEDAMPWSSASNMEPVERPVGYPPPQWPQRSPMAPPPALPPPTSTTSTPSPPPPLAPEPELPPAGMKCVGPRPRRCALAVLEAQADPPYDGYPASRCVDGSRMTYCLAGDWRSPARLSASARVPDGARIEAVAVYFYRTWNAIELAPFEIWLGYSHGDAAARCGSPVVTEPSHFGRPLEVACAGHGGSLSGSAGFTHAMVRQLGRPRRLFISELVLYSAAPTSQARPLSTALAPSMPSAGEVAHAIAARYERGGPSGSLSESGVLIHMLDGYEDPDKPWEICHEVCGRSEVDSISGSLVSRAAPRIFQGSKGGAGLVLAPDTEILCAYPSDAGTGGQPNGGCPAGWSAQLQLKAVLEAQYSQSYVTYNEVVVGSMFYEAALPHLVEAFLFVGDWHYGAASAAHSSFLQTFGLSAAQVPLLRYEEDGGVSEV